MHLVKPCVVWCVCIKCFDKKSSRHGKLTFSQEGGMRVQVKQALVWFLQVDGFLLHQKKKKSANVQGIRAHVKANKYLYITKAAVFKPLKNHFVWLSFIYMWMSQTKEGNHLNAVSDGWFLLEVFSPKCSLFLLLAVFFWLSVSTASCSLLSAYFISLCDAEACLFFIAVLSCVVMSPSFLPLNAGRSSGGSLNAGRSTGGALRKVLWDKKSSFNMTVSPQLVLMKAEMNSSQSVSKIV